MSNNPVKIIYRVIQTQGISAIYTGCTTLVVGTTGKAAVRFLSFDTIKAALSDPSGKLGPVQGVIAGMGAGIVESTFAVTPSERLKTALISDAKGEKRLKNGFHAAQMIFQEKGLSGFYQGFLATTMKQAATSAVRMGTYSCLKELSKGFTAPNNTLTTFTIGAVAGTITVYATQPFDTIKTRAQTVKGETTREALRSVLSEAGVRGLWKGSTMRLGRLILSGGIVFSIYENMSHLLSGEPR
jgi:solute carrier family 25 citrate transporter 1